MIETLSKALEPLKVKYRRWRLPDHTVHRSTRALFDVAIAELEAEDEVCLEELQFTDTTKADARDAFRELEEKGFLAPVEGKEDTWERGELFDVFDNGGS